MPLETVEWNRLSSCGFAQATESITGNAPEAQARTAQMLDGRIAFGETYLFVGHGYKWPSRDVGAWSALAVESRRSLVGRNVNVRSVSDFPTVKDSLEGRPRS